MPNQKIVTEAALSAIASDIKNALSGKANSNEVYTKTEIDNALELKADKSELYNVYPTDQESGAIASFTDGADNIPVKSLVSQIVAVESGSGEKSPTNPYSISGFANGIITRCGKNLIDVSDRTASDNSWAFVHNCYIKKGTYTFSFNLSSSQYNTTQLRLVDTNGTNHDYYFNAYNGLITYTVTTDYDISVVRYYVSKGGTITNIQFEQGNQATTFEAYNGNTYTFTFGQTVYGGYFDNKGNLVVTHGVYIFTGSEGWTKQQNLAKYYTNNYILRSLAKLPPANNQSVPIKTAIGDYNLDYANLHSHTYSMALATDGRIGITEDLYSGEGTLAGTWLYYELETPITLAITSQDIPTLLGENNIFSNCGDVEVNYHADIGLYIDKKISSLAQA